MQASGVVRPLEAHDAGLVVPGCPRHAIAGHEHEAGLVVGVVLDVLGQDHEPVALGGQARGDGRSLRGVGAAQDAGGIGGRVGRSLLGAGQRCGQVLLALGQGMGVRGDGGHVGQLDARTRHQVQVDVHDHLTLHVELDIVDQPVDGGAHRPLNCVLNGNETLMDLPFCHGLEHQSDRPQQDQLLVAARSTSSNRGPPA